MNTALPPSPAAPTLAGAPLFSDPRSVALLARIRQIAPSEASVLVPHERTLPKLSTLRRASSGVVSFA